MGLEMKYFVLKPRSKKVGDPYAKASRVAMQAYAEAIMSTDLELATELKEWIMKEERRDYYRLVGRVVE